MADSWSVPSEEHTTRPLKIVATTAVLLVALAIGSWFTVRWAADPYKAGANVDAVATDCMDLREIGRGVTCWIRIGPDHDLQWIGQASDVPLEWVGHDVAGSLHIIENWGTPSAEFTAGATTVSVWGGKPDHQHFFPA